jgi:hypothetical protein
MITSTLLPFAGWLPARAIGFAATMATALALSATPAAAQEGHQLIVELPGAAAVTLGMDDLAALPRTEFSTSTVWTEQVDHYAGVLLLDLLRHFNLDPATASGSVALIGLDGYSATLGFEMISAEAPLISFLRNGEPMPVRSQGAVFGAIFPLRSQPGLQNRIDLRNQRLANSHCPGP